MKNLDKIDDFYRSLQGISIVNDDLDKKREQLKQMVHHCNDNIQKIDVEKSLLHNNQEIGLLLKDTLSTLKESSNKWVSNFRSLLEGEKFRSDLENYFIVIVFGKVKAGKSSLGNFIAEHRPSSEKVSFFKYDEAGNEQSIQKLEEIDDESFDTDNLECTVAIQGFKLNAMAWVDTPGLGSMVEENGQLAKAYINHADYVIYPTSSDSPLQADEVSQLQELFAQNKKLTVCITKSDITEKRKDKNNEYVRKDGRIARFSINKSIEDRLMQEKHVREEVSKVNHNQSLLGDVNSLSVHAAMLGLEEKDDDLFDNSHLPIFYENLTEVVKNKASQLKKEAPYHGLSSFITHDVLGTQDKELTVHMIKKGIGSLDQKICEIQDKIHALIENIDSDIHREVNDIVEKHYRDINQSNAVQLFQEIHQEIAKIISEIIEQNIKELFQDFQRTLNHFTSTIDGGAFTIEDRYEEYTYSTKTRNKGIGAAVFGVVAGIGAAVLTGGASVVVSLAAGGIAAGAGGYAGGKLGEMTGDTHRGRVNVGDNKEEMIQKFKAQQVVIHGDSCKKVYTHIQHDFFQPLQTKIDEINMEIECFEKNISDFQKGLL
ncbi:MAG: dynamin family protein [Mariprofundaceae bacterium]|nr:dynamin family protein [Mariprofundaceae bacterium]